MAKVTIGIPVKNSERTIADCIQSILKSEFNRSIVEILVVDGGSKDGTLDVIHEILGSSNVRYRKLSDNGKGIAYARQVIVDEATGEYIAWIDSDNVISKDFFVKSLHLIGTHPKAGATRPQLIPLRPKSLVEKLQVYSSTTINHSKSSSQLMSTLLGGMQGVICRIKAVKSVGGFDIKLVAGEDIDLFMRMIKNGWKILHVTTKVYFRLRQDWCGVFNQATWWAYGRHQLSRKYRNSSCFTVEPITIDNAPLIFLKNATSILNTTFRAIKTFKTPEALLLPIYYIYRRVGYLIGYKIAKKTGL